MMSSFLQGGYSLLLKNTCHQKEDLVKNLMRGKEIAPVIPQNIVGSKNIK